MDGAFRPNPPAVVAGPAVTQWGSCTCDRSGEATAIGKALCEINCCDLENLLDSGVHLTNEPCHRAAGSINNVSNMYSLEWCLASHDLIGSGSKTDTDAALVLLLRHGADPAKQTQSETEGDALMERLVNHALAPDTNPEMLERLLALGAGRTYPGGRQAMRDVIESHKPEGPWCARHKEALLPKAAVKPAEPSAPPSLTSLPTVPNSPWSPLTPSQELPGQALAVQLPPIPTPVGFPEADPRDPTCVRRPACGCPPGFVHMCRRYGYQYGNPMVLAEQPTVIVPCCPCGQLWVTCAADYVAGALKH